MFQTVHVKSTRQLIFSHWCFITFIAHIEILNDWRTVSSWRCLSALDAKAQGYNTITHLRAADLNKYNVWNMFWSEISLCLLRSQFPAQRMFFLSTKLMCLCLFVFGNCEMLLWGCKDCKLWIEEREIDIEKYLQSLWNL